MTQVRARFDPSEALFEHAIGLLRVAACTDITVVLVPTVYASHVIVKGLCLLSLLKDTCRLIMMECLVTV